MAIPGLKVEEKQIIFDSIVEFTFKINDLSKKEIEEALIENSFRRGAVPGKIEFNKNKKSGTILSASNVGEELARKIGYISDKKNKVGDFVCRNRLTKDYEKEKNKEK